MLARIKIRVKEKKLTAKIAGKFLRKFFYMNSIKIAFVSIVSFYRKVA